MHCYSGFTGDEELFKAVSVPFDVMGKAKFYLGEVGNGANMKLVLNHVSTLYLSHFVLACLAYLEVLFYSS